jgi:hypothetical protein
MIHCWASENGETTSGIARTAFDGGEQRHERARQIGHVAADAGEVWRRGAGVEDVVGHRPDTCPAMRGSHRLGFQINAYCIGERVEVAQALHQDAINDHVIDLGVVMHDQVAEAGHFQ